MSKKSIICLAISLPLIVVLSVVVYRFFHQWPGDNSAEVRAYAWDPTEDSKSISAHLILEGMTLRPEGLINKNGATLSVDQTQRLLAAVTGSHPAHPFASCYWPHNAFVFYNANKKPIAYVEICFDCLGHRIYPDSDTQYVDLPALAKIFEELKLPTGKNSAAEISKLLDQLHVPNK